MKRIADYELAEVLGEGNHGRFYLAPPPDRLGLGDQRVAVKVLEQNATDDDFRRFANELKLFASVDSPYLVALYDAGQQDGTLFYAMEYFPRGSLDQPTVHLDVDERLRAVAHASRGAHSLHEVGVAHRDIKPGNILLHDDGAKLSDLGLAQVLNPGLTVTGTGPIGAVEFMDPALVRGDKASRATDIWELGTTLHKTLTGRSVYGEIPTGSVLVALRHILETPPHLDDSLEAAQREIVEGCLAPAPEDRPATALDVATQIEALL